MSDKCRKCGSSESYSTEVQAIGGHGPNLLPIGVGWFKTPKFRIQICGQCGLVEWFVPDRFLAKVKEKIPRTP